MSRARSWTYAIARRTAPTETTASPNGDATTLVYLDLSSLLDLTELFLGGPPRVRDMGLLSSAVARPATVAFGVEAYQDVWTKAAALLQSVVLNHALIDGNKRLAWVAARVFLDLNGVPPALVDVDQAEAFVIQVVTHERDTVDDVAKALAALYICGASE